MTAYTYTMSNDKTEAIPAVPVPTRRSILRAAGAHVAGGSSLSPSPSPFADWRDATPTEELPAASSPAFPDVQVPGPARTERLAQSRERAALQPRRRQAWRRHLRSALAALALAAVILIPMQIFAAAGISSARQAALASARLDARADEQAAPAPAAQPDVRSEIQPDWVTEDTGAAYDRTDPLASPLDLPRCTASPDTPLPCLATISPDSKRAVVLEEDASLTALTRH